MGYNSNRPTGAGSEPARLSDDEIDDMLSACAPSSLAYILTHGKLIGREYHCGDVRNKPARRGSNGSFKFNVDKLIGHDFGPTGDKKGFNGVFSVYVGYFNGDRKAARKAALDFLGLAE